jgi:hypothetical protein
MKLKESSVMTFDVTTYQLCQTQDEQKLFVIIQQVICQILVDVIRKVCTEGALRRDCRSGKLNSVGTLSSLWVITGLIIQGNIEYPIDVAVSCEKNGIINLVLDNMIESAFLLSGIGCGSRVLGCFDSRPKHPRH